MLKSLTIIIALFLLVDISSQEKLYEKYTTKDTPSYISSINMAEY